jgi:hypothetical protein
MLTYKRWLAMFTYKRWLATYTYLQAMVSYLYLPTHGGSKTLFFGVGYWAKPYSLHPLFADLSSFVLRF